MPPIVLAALQILLLVLLYLFVARAVRAVVRDVVAPPRSVATRPASARGGAKSAPRPPTELVVHQPSRPPRVIPLDGGHDVTFGRADASTIVLADSFVSDTHARVYLSDGEWFVADLGSTNGTFVNQRRVADPQPLAPGDQLAIGKTTVQVRR